MLRFFNGKRVFITGHRGLVGSALVRSLESQTNAQLLTATRQRVDLRVQSEVDAWFAANRPEIVIHVAGTVGGIHANQSRPVDFLYDNTLIYSTVLKAAHEFAVDKLLYLGSSCIYPRDCPQPIKEEYLLSGKLEPTNEGYALAKISGLFACKAYRRQYGCDFISAMPTNLYGPHDNFDLANSHVLPALIRKFHQAKQSEQRVVEVWGTGTPRREFLHVDDLADACLFLLSEYSEEDPVNIGTGEDLSIAELAACVRDAVYPSAEIVYDSSKPDGTPRKLLDVRRLHSIGWKHQIELPEGIQSTYEWYLQNQDQVRTSHQSVG